MTDSLTLRRPDDWHVHLRDGAMLADTVPHTALQFARAIVMPNLNPPVTTSAEAAGYRVGRAVRKMKASTMIWIVVGILILIGLMAR